MGAALLAVGSMSQAARMEMMVLEAAHLEMVRLEVAHWEMMRLEAARWEMVRLEAARWEAGPLWSNSQVALGPFGLVATRTKS